MTEYKLKGLSEHQDSYTIKQVITLFDINRRILSDWVRAGRFKGVDDIRGKLTGIKDNTVFITDLGEEVTVGALVKECIEKQTQCDYDTTQLLVRGDVPTAGGANCN